MESKTVEYKREYTEEIKYAILAFANTEGGTLYVGINDDGSVCGIAEADKTLLRITNMIRDSIRPDLTMFVNAVVSQMEGKDVAVVSVLRGTARPYYLAAKGVRPEGVYVRQGASSVPASDTAILNMIRETSGNNYEDARSVEQELTFNQTAAYFEKKRIAFGKQQMRSLNLIGEDGAYTNLGMLLSDQCIHTIKMASFDGSKKTTFHDRRELSGSLLKQIEEAFDYLERYNRVRAEFSGLERRDHRDYPPEALREALLNAVVHRDYAVSASTLISIFDDRVEFVSIGGLVKGVSLDDIMLGVSVLRNEHLANVFYRLELIEAYGTGMLRIRECYSDESCEPEIKVSSNAFKITLPNTNYLGNRLQGVKEAPTSSVQNRKNEVFRLFDHKNQITRKDVEEQLGVSQATAILVIREMVGDGLLERLRKGKNVYYIKAGSRSDTGII